MDLRRIPAVVCSALVLSAVVGPPAHASAKDFDPPQVNVDAGAQLITGSTLSDGGRAPAVQARATWSAYDADGICSQQIDYYDYVNDESVSKSLAPTVRSYRLPLLVGYYMDFYITATACSGDLTPTSTYGELYVQLAQEGSAELSTGWRTETCTCYSLGGALRSTRSGAKATYPFYGSSLALVMSKGPNRGSVTVFVDGARRATVDLASPTAAHRVLVWSKRWPVDGSHTVQLVTNSAARVDLDGFVTVQ